MTSLRLLAVLNRLFNYARMVQKTGRRATRALCCAEPLLALRLATWREKRARVGSPSRSHQPIEQRTGWYNSETTCYE